MSTGFSLPAIKSLELQNLASYAQPAKKPASELTLPKIGVLSGGLTANEERTWILEESEIGETSERAATLATELLEKYRDQLSRISDYHYKIGRLAHSSYLWKRETKDSLNEKMERIADMKLNFLTLNADVRKQIGEFEDSLKLMSSIVLKFLHQQSLPDLKATRIEYKEKGMGHLQEISYHMLQIKKKWDQHRSEERIKKEHALAKITHGKMPIRHFNKRIV